MINVKEVSYLKSFLWNAQVVMEELVSIVMAPVGGHLAQQHVVLVMLAHSQTCDLQQQRLRWKYQARLLPHVLPL